MLNPVPHILPSAYLAVDLFFVLSGFVLQNAYKNRLGSSMTAWQFIVARYLRLYPLFAVGAILGSLSAILALFLGAGELSSGGLVLAIISAALLLPSPTWRDTNILFPVNLPGWSLVFELLINIVFAVVYRHLSAFVLAAIIATSGTALIFATLSIGHGDLGSTWSTFLPALPRVAFSFFVGVFICRWHSGRRREGVMGWLIPLVLIPVFAISPDAAFRPLFDLAAIFFIFPAIIILGSAYEPTKEGVSLFKFFGFVSFPIYAIHFPILEGVRRVLRVLHREDMYPMVAVGTCIALVVIAYAIAKMFDEPVRRRFRYYLKFA